MENVFDYIYSYFFILKIVEFNYISPKVGSLFPVYDLFPHTSAIRYQMFAISLQNPQISQ